MNKLVLFINTHKDIINPTEHNIKYEKIISSCELYNKYNCPTIRLKNNKLHNLYAEIDGIVNINEKEYINYEYVGFQQNKRRFNITLTDKLIDEIFSKHDIITTQKMYLNLYSQFVHCHGKKPIDDIIYIMQKLYPEYCEFSNNFHSINHIYPHSSFIMPQNKYIIYKNFCKSIYDEFIKMNNFKDMNDVIKYQKTYDNEILSMFKQQYKIISFLSERLTSLFIDFNFKNPCECKITEYNNL